MTPFHRMIPCYRNWIPSRTRFPRSILSLGWVCSNRVFSLILQTSPRPLFLARRFGRTALHPSCRTIHDLVVSGPASWIRWSRRNFRIPFLIHSPLRHRKGFHYSIALPEPLRRRITAFHPRSSCTHRPVVFSYKNLLLDEKDSV